MRNEVLMDELEKFLSERKETYTRGENYIAVDLRNRHKRMKLLLYSDNGEKLDMRVFYLFGIKKRAWLSFLVFKEYFDQKYAFAKLCRSENIITCEHQIIMGDVFDMTSFETVYDLLIIAASDAYGMLYKKMHRMPMHTMTDRRYIEIYEEIQKNIQYMGEEVEWES